MDPATVNALLQSLVAAMKGELSNLARNAADRRIVEREQQQNRNQVGRRPEPAVKPWYHHEFIAQIALLCAQKEGRLGPFHEKLKEGDLLRALAHDLSKNYTLLPEGKVSVPKSLAISNSRIRSRKRYSMSTEAWIMKSACKLPSSSRLHGMNKKFPALSNPH